MLADESVILDLYQLTKKLRQEGDTEVLEGVCLIRSQKRPVLVKRSKQMKGVMKEIVAQLLFYENEVDFRQSCLLKMRDFFHVKGQYHIIYDRPGDSYLSLERQTHFGEAHLVKLALDLGRAICAVHANGLVHAKLNSESVVCSYDEAAETARLVVTDFDRSFFEHESPRQVEVDCCSAPELVIGAQHVDRRADYWSFGCVLFYLATGKHLFPTTSKSGIVYMVLAAHQMDKLRLGGTSLTACHPNCLTFTSKVDEVTRLDLDDCLLGRKEILEDLRQSQPRLFKLISDSLKYDSRER